MVLEGHAADIVYTSAVSGVHASFLRQSLENNGFDIATLSGAGGEVDLKVSVMRPRPGRLSGRRDKALVELMMFRQRLNFAIASSMNILQQLRNSPGFPRVMVDH